MIEIKQNKLKSMGTLLSFCAILAYNNAWASSEALESSWYVGGSLGISGLEPDGHSNWNVTDGSDMAYKVYAGLDISRNVSLEGFWNDFGNAKLSRNASDMDATVSYQGYGGNLIYHIPSYLGELHPIVKLGVAKLNTEGQGVGVTQQNNFDIMMGVGAEYALGKGFRVRAEYDFFDKDIDQLSIGLSWRPVSRSKVINRAKGLRTKGLVKKLQSTQPIIIVNNPKPTTYTQSRQNNHPNIYRHIMDGATVIDGSGVGSAQYLAKKLADQFRAAQ